MSKQLLSPRQLADYLNVPLATLYAWRYHGEGPPGFRVGKHVRYRWNDVQVWVQDQLETARAHRARSTVTGDDPVSHHLGPR